MTDTRLERALILAREARDLVIEVRTEVDPEIDTCGGLALLRTQDHLKRAASQLESGIKDWFK